MTSFILIYVIIIVIFFVFLYFDNINSELKKVKSKIDNRFYLVRNEPDQQQAADTLANVRKKIIELTNYLEAKYPKDKRVQRLIKYKPDNIVESSEHSKYTSYSINKGEKIVFCLRSRNSEKKLVDLNLLMFVALHEIAHVVTVSIGHTDEFWDNFKWILQQAVSIKLYTPHNFSKKPEEYCGTHITDSPLDN